MARIVVYTAVFGDIGDQLRRPAPQGRDVELVAFVDDPSAGHSEGWSLRPAAELLPDKRRQARWHKCHPHLLFPDAWATLWVDGVLTPRVDVAGWAPGLLERSQLAVFKHCQRSCVYQELEACLRLRKDRPAVMRAQVSRYREEGYPHHNGLAETTAVLRLSCDRTRELNQLWWGQIAGGSLRDQLSLDYVCWRMGLRYGLLSGARTDSEWFSWRAHRGGR